MKLLTSFFYLFIAVMMTLMISYPIQNLTSSETTSPIELNQTPSLNGNLTNGLSFTINSSNKLKGGSWIKLSCKIANTPENELLSLLTQHTLFYGAQNLNREELASKLDALGMDIEADHYVKFNESEISMEFCSGDSQLETLKTFLQILNHIVFHPSLLPEEIELARSHLFTIENTPEKILALQSLTSMEVKKFYEEWYRPENMNLIIVGEFNAEEALSLISETYDSDINEKNEFNSPSDEFPSINFENGRSNIFFAQHIEWSQDHQWLVVDGKIWMKEPNWINKKNNGKTIGTILTIIGIAGMIIAFPIIAPVAIIAGTLSTATGIYFLASSYLKDPVYVESVRQIDLKKGCAHAYKNSRAGITLTPYERRALFLQELVDHPQTLSKLPILLVADFYQLNDPVIAEIFTVDEFNLLTNLKRDFIQQRNHYKLLKENLNKELACLIAPYTQARDLALFQAKELYNANYFVQSKYRYQVTLNESIANIEEALKNNTISEEERNYYIDQARAQYESCVSSPEFKVGLTLAEMALSQMEADIQATYNYQVEMCKNSIQYEQRMEYYNQGIIYIINYYNQELINLLSTFPVYDTLFPDYLDLRAL